MSKLISDTMNLEQQLLAAKKLQSGELLEAAVNYNWDMYPAEVLGYMVNRPDCSLLTALTIFDLGEPSCYDVPEDGQDPEILALLQRIHDGVNAREYKHVQEDHDRGWLGDNSLRPFVREQVEGHRWHIDPDIALPAFELSRDQADARERQRNLWIDKQATQLFAGLTGNTRAQSVTEKLLPLCDNAIQKRLDELMLEQGFLKASKWRFSSIRKSLLQRVSQT